MRTIFIALLLGFWITSIQAQYALGDGHALDRPLRVGDTHNPTIDPLAHHNHRTPANDGLGGHRYTERYVQEGWRFAPEFSRGTSIYHRSLIFDREGYSGWDLRKDAIKKAEVQSSPTQGQIPVVPTETVSAGRGEARIDLRIDTRVQGRQVEQAARAQATSREPLSDRQPLPLGTQLKLFESVAKMRVEDLKLEKQKHGDIKERALSLVSHTLDAQMTVQIEYVKRLERMSLRQLLRHALELKKLEMDTDLTAERDRILNEFGSELKKLFKEE